MSIQCNSIRLCENWKGVMQAVSAKKGNHIVLRWFRPRIDLVSVLHDKSNACWCNLRLSDFAIWTTISFTFLGCEDEVFCTKDDLFYNWCRLSLRQHLQMCKTFCWEWGWDEYFAQVFVKNPCQNFDASYYDIVRWLII